MKPLQFRKQHLCICCFLGVLLLSSSSWAVSEDNPADQIVVFKWAFVALIGSGDTSKMAAITEDTVLSSGDRFKMMVELQSQCFVYVLFKASNGELLKLFQEKLSTQVSDSTGVKRKFYLPADDLWYLLDDDTGKEKVYLLASKNRLEKLESLLEKYESAGDERNTLAVEIVAHIKEIRKRQKRFTVKAERPVQIGGTFRGTVKGSALSRNVEDFALTLSGESFFVKTFTIEHR